MSAGDAGCRRRRFGSVVAAVVLVAAGTALVAAGGGLAATDEGEPNDDRANATTIQPGSAVTGGLPAGGDTDWFAVEVERGETIRASVEVERGNGKFRIIPPDGSDSVAYARARNSSITLGATARTTGTYYIKGVDSPALPAYRLEVETYSTDPFEPNEVLAEALRIDPPTEQTGTLSIHDTDWFAFDVERGETIRAAVGVTRGNGKFRIFPPDGSDSVAYARARNESATLGTTARTSGTYYLRGRASPGIEAYTIGLETVSTDPFEPNENRSMAVPLEPGVERAGTISIGDVDWFAVGAEGGAPLNVTMTVTDGSSDLRLFPPAAQADALGSDAVVNGTTTVGTVTGTSGTYYVRVANDGPGGDYTLLVNGSAARDPDLGGDGGTDAGSGGTDAGTREEETTGSLPVLPILLAVVVVGVLLVVLAWRRRDGDDRQSQPP